MSLQRIEEMDEICLTKEYKFSPEHLCLPITEIAEDFTFMDFFTLVKRASDEHPWLLDVLEYPTWFGEMYDEILKDPSESDNHTRDIDHLIVCPCLDDDDHEDLGNVHVVCHMFDIYGIGKDNECGNSYGISGCRINDLKHLIIKLNPILRNRLIQHPTLLQFMHGILWELTFFGGPTQRDEKIEEINQTCEDIKEGKVETFPMPPTPPETQRRYGLNYVSLGLNFVECSQIDLDAAELFIKDDEELKDIRKRLYEVINDLKEMVSDDEDTLDNLLI